MAVPVAVQVQAHNPAVLVRHLDVGSGCQVSCCSANVSAMLWVLTVMYIPKILLEPTYRACHNLEPMSD